MAPSALDRAVLSMLSDDCEGEDLDKTIAEMILQEAREKSQGRAPAPVSTREEG